MNLPRTTAATLLTAAMLLGGCSGAASSEITVSDARVPVPPGPNGAAYMTLANDGDADDRLIAATTDVAGSAELHETATDGGTMSMQPVEGIAVPAGGQAVLEPGGLHIMLLDVAGDLREGDTVELTLTFDVAGEQTVTAEVVPTGDMPPMDMGSEGVTMGSESMETASEPMEMRSEG